MMHAVPAAQMDMKGEKKHKPRVYIPIEKNWHEELAVGEETIVVLRGTVHSFTVSEKDEGGYERNELCLTVSDVHILEEDEANEFAEMVEGD